MSYPAYAEYKDSTFKRLGKFPTYWSVVPFTKYILEKSDYRGKTPPKTDEGIFLVTAKNIRMGFIDYQISQEYIAKDDYEDTMRRGLPKLSDILFTTEAPLGNVALVDNEKVAMAQRIIRFRMKPSQFDPKFTLFAMMSDFFQNQLKTLSTGSTAEGLKASKLNALKITRPPYSEQIAIATFLDRETAKIDELIAEQENLIKLLQEKRQALISHAVTKGLNPEVKMKDSGVEWIGEVPEHWRILSIGRIFSERVEKGIEGLPILSVSIHSGISDRELTQEESDRKLQRIEKKENYKRVYKNDVAYNMMRAWQGAVGSVQVDGLVGRSRSAEKSSAQVPINLRCNLTPSGIGGDIQARI